MNVYLCNIFFSIVRFSVSSLGTLCVKDTSRKSKRDHVFRGGRRGCTFVLLHCHCVFVPACIHFFYKLSNNSCLIVYIVTFSIYVYFIFSITCILNLIRNLVFFQHTTIRVGLYYIAATTAIDSCTSISSFIYTCNCFNSN